MKWYVAKFVYRIVCGNGDHMAQFDEQLRFISGRSKEEAFEKAATIGKSEEETFYNLKQQMVQWQFVNVSELHHLHEMTDGAELCSRINEVEDADAYATFVHWKAACIRQKHNDPVLI